MEAPTAAEMRRWIDEAFRGQVFYGYKGGEYTYGATDPVNVASYGEAWAPEAIGFAIEDGHLVIKTRPHQD